MLPRTSLHARSRPADWTSDKEDTSCWIFRILPCTAAIDDCMDIAHESPISLLLTRNLRYRLSEMMSNALAQKKSVNWDSVMSQPTASAGQRTGPGAGIWAKDEGAGSPDRLALLLGLEARAGCPERCIGQASVWSATGARGYKRVADCPRWRALFYPEPRRSCSSQYGTHSPNQSGPRSHSWPGFFFQVQSRWPTSSPLGTNPLAKRPRNSKREQHAPKEAGKRTPGPDLQAARRSKYIC